MINTETSKIMDQEIVPNLNASSEMTPRQTAIDTLQSLIPFTTAIASLSRAIGESIWANESVSNDFHRMLEGIQILVDGFQTSRVILGVAAHDPSDQLHRELVSLLQELTASMEQDASESLEQRVNLLTVVIPAHLNEWVSSGIPSLLQNQG